MTLWRLRLRTTLSVISTWWIFKSSWAVSPPLSPTTTSRQSPVGPVFQCPLSQCQPLCPTQARVARPHQGASMNCVAPAAAAKQECFMTTTPPAVVSFPSWLMRWLQWAVSQAWIQTGSWASEAPRRAKYPSLIWSFLTEDRSFPNLNLCCDLIFILCCTFFPSQFLFKVTHRYFN